MTVHTYHEDTHTHGLADDCPRCQEHAQHPESSLDRVNIRRLLEGSVLTMTDRIAAAKLKDIWLKGLYLEQIRTGGGELS